MARGAQLIKHKKKEIYFIDYSGIRTSREFLNTIKQTGAFREKVKAMGKKDLLILVNITGSYLNIEILDELKKAGRIIKEITRKEAIVGITGYKKILLQIVQTFTNLRFNVFNTLEDAKNWLVEEQKEM
jgi:hypothetical protein